MKKLTYSNPLRWPDNLNVLEDYVKRIIKNQNEIIDFLDHHSEKGGEKSPLECCEKCGTKKFNYGVKGYKPIDHCEDLDCDCHQPSDCQPSEPKRECNCACPVNTKVGDCPCPCHPKECNCLGGIYLTLKTHFEKHLWKKLT